MKEVIKKMVSFFGYRLEKKEALRLVDNDPRELPYLKNLPFSVMNLPTDKGVGLRFYPLTGVTCHPFVLALKKASKVEEPQEHIFNTLKTYADLVTFYSANEYLGLGEEKIFPPDSHPFEFTYPWSALLPEHRKNYFLTVRREENLRHGFDSGEFLETSSVSDEKIRVESKRLIELLWSIEKNGYSPRYHDALNCFVLMKDGEWKWYVESGQHRASVLAALGYQKIPAHVRQIVRREDARFWPAVQSGLFSERIALALFDKMFNLESRAVARDWVDHVRKTYDDPAGRMKKTTMM